MSINKHLFTIFITFLVLSSMFITNSDAQLIQIYDINKFTDYNGYIIQFKQESIIEYKNQLKIKLKNQFFNLTEKIINMLLNLNLKNYKNHLLSIHNNAKQDILKILNNNDLSNEIIHSEFINLFNGLSVSNMSGEFLQSIKDLSYVQNVIPNYLISVTLDESIPMINADDVWKIKDSYNRNVTGKGVTIAVLDTGVDYTHADLKDNYIQDGSYDFINNDTDPMDDYGHGTHCAGIICGKGNSSNFQYIGVAPDAKFYAIKILNEKGQGSFETYLEGMEKAVDPNDDGDMSDHADIISLSFGTNTPGRPDDPLCEVLDNVVKEGVVVVVAAGNLGPELNTITSPGCAIQSICVGSVDKSGVIATSSSRGPVVWDGNYMVKPDLVAPGVGITSSKNGGGYIVKSGTSMAAPHVAGVAALILQANPDFEPEKVKQVLIENAEDLGYQSNTQGEGILNALNVFKEDNLVIDAPYEVDEFKWFRIKITDKNENPVKALILITFPFNFPRLKYGASVIFKAPIIWLNEKEILKGKIWVFKLNEESKIIQKDIIILNTKKLVTH